MKKSILILGLLFTSLCFSQRNWSVELGLGNHTIADECSDLRDNLYHLDGVVRYSFNEKFGVGVYMGYDRLSLENFITKAESNTNYFRATLEGVTDVTEITNLGNNTFTLLAHGGFGATYFDVDNGYSNVLPNLSGGLTGLFKISRSLALKADYSTTAHFNQGNTLNGEHGVTNVGINSFINNATVGAVLYLGKGKNNSKEHYDWYEEPVEDDTWKTNVINKVRDLERNAGNVVVVSPVIDNDCCVDKLNEHVFYREDKFEIDQSELNAILNVYEFLVRNPNANLDIVSFACTTHGSDRYNLELSKKRSKAVYNKLISMGIDANRLTHRGEGKDKKYVGKPDSDIAKRTEFRIK